MDFLQGLNVTIIGLALVFMSLVMLMIAMMLLDRFFPYVPEASTPTAPVVAPAPAAPVAVFGSRSLSVGNQSHSVEVRSTGNSHKVVVIDGKEHRVEQKDGKLIVDGAPFLAEVVESSADSLGVKIDGIVYRIGLPVPVSTAPVAQATPQPDLSASSVAEGVAVPAPLPGRILKVSVEIGQSVTRGQELCVIEAMKMENSIRAPQDGTVKDVRVAVGQTVTPGAVLIII